MSQQQHTATDANQVLMPLQYAYDAHDVALNAIDKDLELTKAKILQMQRGPQTDQVRERIRKAWEHYHTVNNHREAAVNLINSLMHEIQRLQYHVATANELNKALKFRLEAAQVKPRRENIQRTMFYEGREAARTNSIINTMVDFGL